jgi:hypothetical protein
MSLPEGLKQFNSAADNRLAMIDDRLLEHWQRESAARARLRDSLPTSWRDDPRPNMDIVRELYIEAMLRLKDPNVPPMAIGDDDR